MELSERTKEVICLDLCNKVRKNEFPPGIFGQRNCLDRCNMSIDFEECWYNRVKIPKNTGYLNELQSISNCLKERTKND